jgi:hypothetical protein
LSSISTFQAEESLIPFEQSFIKDLISISNNELVTARRMFILKSINHK